MLSSEDPDTQRKIARLQQKMGGGESLLTSLATGRVRPALDNFRRTAAAPTHRPKPRLQRVKDDPIFQTAG